jgi:hypothetical protein
MTPNYFVNGHIFVENNDKDSLYCAEIDMKDEKLVEKLLNMKLVEFGSCNAWWGYATESQIDVIKTIVNQRKGCITLQNIKESNSIYQTTSDYEDLNYKNCDESGVIFYYNEMNRLFCVDKYTRKGDKEADYAPYQSFKNIKIRGD